MWERTGGVVSQQLNSKDQGSSNGHPQTWSDVGRLGGNFTGDQDRGLRCRAVSAQYHYPYL